jgi:hypothetical protein
MIQLQVFHDVAEIFPYYRGLLRMQGMRVLQRGLYGSDRG